MAQRSEQAPARRDLAARQGRLAARSTTSRPGTRNHDKEDRQQAMSKTTTDDEAIRQATTSRLVEAADHIEEAIARLISADEAFTELTDGWLADPDLAESGTGADARERLAQACADLRDVARIVQNRQLRQHIIALEDRR
jgi:hypothetical protein